MPYEIRHLVFSQEELLTALEAHKKSGPTELQKGQLRSISTSAGSVPSLSANIEVPNQDELQEMPLSPEFCVAAMVKYCIDQMIPMPKRGEKTLELIDGRPSLKVYISDDDRKADSTDYFILL